MRNGFKHLTSLILPFTVLIWIPLSIEPNFSIKIVSVFVAGILVMSAGATLICVTIYELGRSGKGTLAPWFPTGKLVIRGLYAYVRNPMILGVLTVLAGEAIAFMSWKIFEWMILFFVINQLYFMVYEEPSLERRFGKEYLEYKRKVRRWIPRLKPYQNEAGDENRSVKPVK
jgi:protein-S-isoprenylcysteine O-methyltransferase Ste14